MEMTQKVRFGIIGTNFITDWVIAGAKEDPRFELTAVCSRTEERAREFAAKYAIPHTFTSLEEMAKSDAIDAVYIATPNSTHAPYSIMCMNHGKHVLCEKPLASNAREVQSMIDAARRNGVALMEAMIATLNPNFDIISRHIADVGTVRRYFGSYCQYSSRYDKFKQGIVLNAFRRELSNGAIMDIGVYTIYPMVALFGKPESITAQGSLLSTGVDGQGTVTFRYPGMEASVIFSKIADSYLPGIIDGEKASLVIDKIQTPESVVLRNRQGSSELGVRFDHDIYYYEVAEFIDLIVNHKQQSTINSWATSLATIEIIDEIRRQMGVVFPADNQ
ncbi:MAG: Gfo/Idh/MocA family protein [Muribaculaceae bacterium]